LAKILDERPSNAVELFEDFSRKVKEDRFVSNADNLLDRPDKSAESLLAETQLNLFAVTENYRSANFCRKKVLRLMTFAFRSSVWRKIFHQFFGVSVFTARCT